MSEVFNISDWVKIVPDTMKEYLPGSEKYFVQVRRLTRKELLQRANISAIEVRKEAITMEGLKRQKEEGYVDVEKRADLAKFRFYMYVVGITDYCLPVCVNGKIEDRTFSKDSRYNDTTYNLMSDKIASWIDDLNDRINGETEEAEESVGKAEAFLDESLSSLPTDLE